MRMTCLNERVVGAILFMLSGAVLAGELVVDPPEEMMLANIAPPPAEVIAPIPEPQRYLQTYEMESTPKQGGPFYTQIENFYSAEVPHEFRLGAGEAAAASQGATQAASNYLHLGPSTAPQLAIVELPNAALTLGAEPQRRLSLTVNDWVFSGTARVAVFHSHTTGATLLVRHGF
jgi:hypothetical protein